MKRSEPARSSDAVKVSTKDGESYADILKEMKAKVRRTRKEEGICALKKGGDVSAIHKELDQAVGERAEISASGGNDPTKTTGSHGPRERSLGKPVRLSKRQVHSRRHPGNGGHRH